jgi:hypothetical protein
MKAGVILLVQADGDLMSLIDGNIFSQSLAEHTVDNPPSGLTFPRIHMRIVGGAAPPEAWGALNKQNLIVQCWSKEDYDEAWYITENFIRVVNGETVDSLAEGTFDYKVTNPGQEVFDPTQTLYYIVSQFRVNMIQC